MTIEYKDSKRIVGLSKSTTVANTKSISSQTTNVIDLAVKPDGTEIYVATEDTGKVITYELATAGDVSTAVYNSSKDYTHSLTNPKGMDWNNDGTKIYLASFNTEKVHTYTVSTAYNLSSTVTQVGTGVDLSGIDGAQGLQWSHDGAYLFLADNSGVIFRYQVSSAFVVSDGTRTSFNPSETTAVTGISFGDNGKEMYIVSHANTGLFKYTLSTAYDLSTATHDSTLTTTDADNQGIATSNGKIYVLGQTTDIVTDYNNDIRPTDVQDNSIMVEKDTARRYWFDADPTYTTVEAGATADSNGGAAYVTYKQITGLTAGDEISHVTFDVYSTPTDTSFKGGIYTDSSNNPTTLLASGELTNQNVSNTYTTLSIPLTSNATVPSDGKVWVAIIPNKTNPLLRVSTSSSSYTNSKFSTTSGSYTNYSNWMLSTASVQGSGENNVRFGVKIYHAPAWTMQPTFRDDFSTDNFTDGGGGDIAVSGGSLVYDCGSGGTSDSRSYYDLGTNVSETKWLLRFKMTSTTLSPNPSSCHVGFGLSSISSTWDTNGNGLCFVRGASTNANDNQYYMNRCTNADYVDNGTSNKAGFSTSTGNVTNQVYYVELKRTSATTVVATIFSDAYATSVESETFTDLSGVTGLRYLKCASRSQNTNTNNGTIDDVEFYNGVTSIN